MAARIQTCLPPAFFRFYLHDSGSSRRTQSRGNLARPPAVGFLRMDARACFTRQLTEPGRPDGHAAPGLTYPNQTKSVREIRDLRRRTEIESRADNRPNATAIQPMWAAGERRGPAPEKGGRPQRWEGPILKVGKASPNGVKKSRFLAYAAHSLSQKTRRQEKKMPNTFVGRISKVCQTSRGLELKARAKNIRDIFISFMAIFYSALGPMRAHASRTPIISLSSSL